MVSESIFQIFQELGIAVALASLIGLEREHVYQKTNVEDFAGLRTFMLMGLFGALSYMLFADNVAIFTALTSGFLALIVASYVVTSHRKYGSGVTSQVAAIIIYLVGILCAMDQYVFATTVTLAMLTVLYFKTALHKWVRSIKDEELLSTIQFAVIAFVVLPLLPNHGYGPYEVFNPYIIWLMVVLVSGISFLSYIAIKIFGAKRGVGISGFLGGLISSTALTLSFSEQSKKNPKIVNPYAFAVIIASTAMFFRIAVLVAILNKELFAHVAIPLVTMGLAGLVCAGFLWTRSENETVKQGARGSIVKFKSPFSMIPALKFAVIFAAVLFLSKYAVVKMGNSGLYLTSIVSSFLDADPIAISVTKLVKEGLTMFSASVAVTIAVFVNTISKGIIFFVLGNRAVALKILISMGFMITCGAISLFFV